MAHWLPVNTSSNPDHIADYVFAIAISADGRNIFQRVPYSFNRMRYRYERGGDVPNWFLAWECNQTWLASLAPVQPLDTGSKAPGLEWFDEDYAA